MSGMQASKIRSRGRPVADSSGDIRQRIIEKALERFASQGYAATSVRQIAESAGVNGAMIHYYFGNKEGLLLEALETITAPFAKALAAMKEQGQAPVEQIVNVIFSTFQKHPDIPVLVTREVLLPGGAAQGLFLENLASRLGGAIPGLLEGEQARGKLRSELDPSITALQILSLCAFPFISRNISGPALGLTFDADGVEELRRQVISVLQSGVES